MTAPIQRIAVLGAGGWGTAMAANLVRAGRSVRLWMREPELAEAIRAEGENRRYLPGVRLPAELEAGSEAARMLDGAELVVLAVPVQFLRATLAPLAPNIPEGAGLLSLSKGLERGTLLRPTEIVAQVLGPRPRAVLSGPNHAPEVARGLPASAVVASAEAAFRDEVQRAFKHERFRIYTAEDVIGVELGGALKNVIALAAGMVDGLGLGDNAKAALLCRGLMEMARLGEALGARRETFAGLSGLGDLVSTSYSEHGRNLRFGRRLAAGETLDAIRASTRQVAEGVGTAPAMKALAAEAGVEVPIAEAVVEVIEGRLSPAQAAQELMRREPKAEDE